MHAARTLSSLAVGDEISVWKLASCRARQHTTTPIASRAASRRPNCDYSTPRSRESRRALSV